MANHAARAGVSTAAFSSLTVSRVTNDMSTHVAFIQITNLFVAVWAFHKDRVILCYLVGISKVGREQALKQGQMVAPALTTTKNGLRPKP